MLTEEYLIRVLTWLWLCAAIGLIFGIKYVVLNYIKPAQIKHKHTIDRYKKYIRYCDKKGKLPLKFSQWKFAYNKNIQAHK